MFYLFFGQSNYNTGGFFMQQLEPKTALVVSIVSSKRKSRFFKGFNNCKT